MLTKAKVRLFSLLNKDSKKIDDFLTFAQSKFRDSSISANVLLPSEIQSLQSEFRELYQATSRSVQFWFLSMLSFSIPTVISGALFTNVDATKISGSFAITTLYFVFAIAWTMLLISGLQVYAYYHKREDLDDVKYDFELVLDESSILSISQMRHYPAVSVYLSKLREANRTSILGGEYRELSSMYSSEKLINLICSTQSN